MGPDQLAAPNLVCRIDPMRAVDFGVIGGTQFHDDQIAEIVREEEPVVVLHHEDVGPICGAFARRGLIGVPEPLAIIEPDAEEPAAVSSAIDAAVLDERPVHCAVDAAASVALPSHLGGQTVVRHAQAPGLAAVAHDENGIPLGDRRCDGHAESRLDQVLYRFHGAQAVNHRQLAFHAVDAVEAVLTLYGLLEAVVGGAVQFGEVFNSQARTK